MATSLFALTVSSAVFATADTGSGNINFTGKIISAACNIAINGNQNGTVNLGQWPTSTFKEIGDKSIPQKFTIDVTECTDGNFKFNFTGTSDTANSNLLKVSVADGVGIAIADANNTQIKLNTTAGEESNANVSIANGKGAASLPLQAYYQSTKDQVGAGQADATVRVTLQQK